MKFFLDTASIKDIRHWQSLGLVDGITTNPVLLAKTGVDPYIRLKEILAISDFPVSAQLTATDKDGMLHQAERFAELGSNIVLKVPACPMGFHVASELKKNGIKANITLVFHSTQALPFIRLDVDYLSLFVAVAEDAGVQQDDSMTTLRKAIKDMDSQTQVILCSIRGPGHLWRAVKANPDVITVLVAGGNHLRAHHAHVRIEGLDVGVVTIAVEPAEIRCAQRVKSLSRTTAGNLGRDVGVGYLHHFEGVSLSCLFAGVLSQGLKTIITQLFGQIMGNLYLYLLKNCL